MICSGKCKDKQVWKRNTQAVSRLTDVRIFVVFEDFPEFKVTRHDRELQHGEHTGCR